MIKILIFTASLALLAAQLSPTPVQAAPLADGEIFTNVATTTYGATVTVSSTYGGYVASNAIDGNDGTLWSGIDPVAGQWIKVDLGSITTIARLRVLQHSTQSYFRATSITIDTSMNNIDWTNQGTLTTSGYDNIFDFAAPIETRYVRLTANAGGGGGWQVNTLEIFTKSIIDGVTMLTPSVTVDAALSTAIRGYLEAAMPYPTYQYAVTNIDTLADSSLLISYIALTAVSDPENWNAFENALGMGTLTALNQSGTYIVSAGPGDLSASSSSGSSYIFPFASGSSAAFGARGVHDAGFSMAGYKAVDFWSDGASGHAANAVYAAAGGKVAWICRDGYQQAMQIGPFVYAHLSPNGAKTGDEYTQGQLISSLKTGNIASTYKCGWASQAAGSFHLHFGFKPQGIPNGAGITIESWTLNISNQQWTNGNKTVAVGGWLPATWTGSTPNPGSGATFASGLWNGILSGFLGIVNIIVPIFPDHEAQNIGLHVTAALSTYLAVFYMLIKTTFRMEIPIIVVSIIITLELVRMAYAAWKLILKALPLVG